jgi:hypothetical protein
MRTLLIAAGALLLIASVYAARRVDAQQQQFYDCQLDAIKMFPGDWPPPVSPDSQSAAYIGICMGAAGYQITVSSSCGRLDGARAFDPMCYIPIGQIDRFLYRIDTAIEGWVHEPLVR